MSNRRNKRNKRINPVDILSNIFKYDNMLLIWSIVIYENNATMMYIKGGLSLFAAAVMAEVDMDSIENELILKSLNVYKDVCPKVDSDVIRTGTKLNSMMNSMMIYRIFCDDISGIVSLFITNRGGIVGTLPFESLMDNVKKCEEKILEKTVLGYTFIVRITDTNPDHFGESDTKDNELSIPKLDDDFTQFFTIVMLSHPRKESIDYYVIMSYNHKYTLADWCSTDKDKHRSIPADHNYFARPI